MVFVTVTPPTTATTNVTTTTCNVTTDDELTDVDEKKLLWQRVIKAIYEKFTSFLTCFFL